VEECKTSAEGINMWPLKNTTESKWTEAFKSRLSREWPHEDYTLIISSLKSWLQSRRFTVFHQVWTKFKIESWLSFIHVLESQTGKGT